MQLTVCRCRPAIYKSALSRPRTVSRQRFVVSVSNKLVLYPTGNGSSDHLGEKVAPPGPITLQSGVFELGRQAPSDIIIAVPTVSSRHALIRVDGTTVSVTDLNSTNGTMVNGTSLTPLKAAELPVGGEVVFGDGYLAKFALQEVPEPQEESSSDS